MRFIKRAMLVAFGLFVIWFGVAWSHWLPLTTDVQRKALAILAAPPAMAKGQHNAFATLWLAQYDIPAADRDKVMAADIARFHPASADEAAAEFVSSAEGHYPRQAPEPVSAQVLCSLKDEDCLAKVRENTGAIRKVLSEHDLVLDHLRSLDSADYYQSIFPDSLNSPIPSFLGNGQLQIADAAVQFVDGDKAEGLTRACSTANNWRRLAIHSDNLIAKMLGVAIFDAAADLFADMLAEMPADAPLPDACTSAFAPIAEAHLSLCDTMKREFHATEAVMNQIGVRGATILAGEHGSRASDLFGSLLFNARASSAQSAVGAATFCSADPEIAAEDARMRSAQWWQVGGWQGALFNPVGGVLTAIARPSYNEYALRMHELQRMDVLVRAAVAMRNDVLVRAAMAMRNNATQAKGSAVTAADVGALPVGVTFDAQHGQLRIKRAFYRADRSADFSIPLPASRLH